MISSIVAVMKARAVARRRYRRAARPGTARLNEFRLLRPSRLGLALRAAPGGRRVGPRQRVLRISLGERLCGRGCRLLRLRGELLIEPLRAGHRLVPKVCERLRADLARVRLTRAELTHV